MTLKKFQILKCLRLCKYSKIQKSPKSEPLLVPSILEKGQFTYNHGNRHLDGTYDFLGIVLRVLPITCHYPSQQQQQVGSTLTTSILEIRKLRQ